jgi:hypothetical protein
VQAPLTQGIVDTTACVTFSKFYWMWCERSKGLGTPCGIQEYSDLSDDHNGHAIMTDKNDANTYILVCIMDVCLNTSRNTW